MAGVLTVAAAIRQAGVADALAHAIGEFEMMAIARTQIRAGLRDADDRLARRELLARQSVIEVALQIERGHARIVGIIEPQLRAQALPSRALRIVASGHCRLRTPSLHIS